VNTEIGQVSLDQLKKYRIEETRLKFFFLDEKSFDIPKSANSGQKISLIKDVKQLIFVTYVCRNLILVPCKISFYAAGSLKAHI